MESRKAKVERISRRELLAVSKTADRSRKISTEKRQDCFHKVTFARGGSVKAKLNRVEWLMRIKKQGQANLRKAES